MWEVNVKCVDGTMDVAGLSGGALGIHGLQLGLDGLHPILGLT